ncbi:MAG TPA: BBE domain-containing protein [Thermoleophilia bacterium]|nr:BBE domain-containing protein [Thermoleophilia bacterium]
MGFLRSRVAGGVVTPGDEEYEVERAVWNGMTDKHRAAVVRCRSERDVVVAIEAARRFGLPLAVRGGSHNVAGLATCDGGIVAEEGESQLRAAFGDHYERLVEIKTRWDPGNLFRLNHNVRPQTEGRAA